MTAETGTSGGTTPETRPSGIRLERAYRTSPPGWPEPQPDPNPWPTVCPIIGRLALRWHDALRQEKDLLSRENLPPENLPLTNLMDAIMSSRQPEKEDLRARMVLQWLVAVAAPELLTASEA